MSVSEIESNPQFSRDFSLEEISTIIKQQGIEDIRLDIGKRDITIGNRTDLYRFLVGTGLGTYKLNQKKGILNDREGVPQIDFIHGIAINVIDSSGYGVPFYTHPVHFKLGDTTPWSIRANHRQPVP